jgi:hypothetical protein
MHDGAALSRFLSHPDGAPRQHAAEGGDYVKATRLCEQVLKKEPSNPVALGLQQKLQQVQGREL